MAQRTKVGHYDIVAELGRGGMGVVYKGYEASLHRHVAIKMLSEALADDDSVVERFFREARSMAQLNDPHIVQVYLIGEDQGQPFFAMEFVEGESLSQKLKRERRLDPSEASRILLQVAQGLAAAHDRGVIHRDIKPANLLITQRGLVKVADFGIALATQDFNKKLTGTGQFVGTPGYLSPEVCLGKQVDQRSDVFALGIVYFEMLTGQSPYKDESPLGMMLEVVQAGIPDVREVNASIDPRLSQILQRMVAKEPDERYPDCHQLIADLCAAGVNAAAPITPPRPIAGPVIGTVVNAPTPPELKRPSLAPQVAAGYATDPAAARAAAAAVAPAPVVMPAPAPAPAVHPAVITQRRSSALPWAIAVSLLLGAGGAGAWYLGAFKNLGAGPTLATTPASTVSAPATASSNPPPSAPTTQPPAAPAPTAPVATSPTPATLMSAAVTDAPATPPVQPTTSAAPTQTAASLGGDTTSDQQSVTLTRSGDTAPAPVDVAASDARVEPEATVEQYAEQAPEADASAPGVRAGAPTLTQSPQSAAIGARLANLREQRLAQRDQPGDRAGMRVARANPPPVVESAPPAWSGPPRVIVLGIGDPAVAGSAEMAIEDKLSASGLDVVDEDMINAVARFENGGEPPVGQLVAAASRHAEYVVVVRVVPLGEQQIDYYGESSTLYTARLQVGTYDIRRSRKMGNGWAGQVSFTLLNVDPNTREALEPLLAKIASGLGGRSRG